MKTKGGNIRTIGVTSFHLTESNLSSVSGKKVAVYNLEIEGRTRLLHPMSFFPDTQHFVAYPQFQTQIRYSDLYRLNQELMGQFEGIAFPSFPPKKWFGNKSQRFLTKRMGRLQEYFQELMRIREVSLGDSLLLVVQPVLSCDLLVVGPSKIGKAQFVKRFLHHKPFGADVPPELLPLVTKVKISDISSAVFPDQTAFSEIEQYTPVDVILDGWLVRINSVQLMDVNTDVEAEGAAVVAGTKDAVMVVCKEKNRESRRVAETLEIAINGEKPIQMVELSEVHQSAGALDMLETGEFAFNSFFQLLRKLRQC